MADVKAAVLFLAGVACGFAAKGGDMWPFTGVVCAAIAGTLVGAFVVATFVVVSLSRAQALEPRGPEAGSRP